MKIRFQFAVNQTGPREVEVRMGEEGLPLPHIEIVNLKDLNRQYKLSAAQADALYARAHEAATQQLVRETIEVIE